MHDAPAADTFADLRRMMVDCQVRPFDVTDQAVLDAMLKIPRELFAGSANAAIACSDAVLKLRGAAETRAMPAPMVLARLIQNADLTPACRVLDVAGASGYSAAVMAGLAGSVTALESDAEFTRQANANFAALGLANARGVTGPLDGAAGVNGPYDVILLNGAFERGLEGLLALLAPKGRLLAIRRSPGQTGLASQAVRYDETAGKFSSRTLFGAAGALLAPFAALPAFAF